MKSIAIDFLSCFSFLFVFVHVYTLVHIDRILGNLYQDPDTIRTVACTQRQCLPQYERIKLVLFAIYILTVPIINDPQIIRQTVSHHQLIKNTLKLY